jgi:DNA-binding CsgD family transcriptional regulator
VFDAYAASRRLHRGDGQPVDVAVWVRALGDELPHPYAIVAFAPFRDATGDGPPPAEGLAVSRTDAGERIASISREVRELLGYAAPSPDGADHPPRERADRVAALERHLTRIAREVEAAGLLARDARIVDPERLSALGDLTPRQWDIVTRLLRGERVPVIAKELYLSPSTVRNYLSALYRKLGVHSQAELIELVRQAEIAVAV